MISINPLRPAWFGSISYLAAGLIVAPAWAVVWDGGSGTTDYNDPINWTDNALPGAVLGTDPENAVIGDTAVANPAVVDLASSPSVTPIGDLRIGQGSSSDGVFNHSSGELVVADFKWAFLGVDGDGLNPAEGTYNLSGDATFRQTQVAFSDGNQFHIGLGGGRRTPGADAPNRGELNVSDEAQFIVNNFFVGSNDDNRGTVNQSGGLVSVENWISIGRERGAVGEYNMTGGRLTVTQDGITVGESSGASGSMTLSGDSIVDAGRLRVGRSLSLDEDTAEGGTGWLTVIGDQVDLTVGFLDIGGNDGVSNNGEGTLRFEANANGVSTLEVLDSVTLNDGSVDGFAALEVDLTSAPTGDLMLIDVGELLTGTFQGLPEGAAVPNSGGRTITYLGGDGNDIVLLSSNDPNIPEPSTAVMLAIAGVGLLGRRR